MRRSSQTGKTPRRPPPRPSNVVIQARKSLFALRLGIRLRVYQTSICRTTGASCIGPYPPPRPLPSDRCSPQTPTRHCFRLRLSFPPSLIVIPAQAGIHTSAGRHGPSVSTHPSSVPRRRESTPMTHQHVTQRLDRRRPPSVVPAKTGVRQCQPPPPDNMSPRAERGV